MSIRNAGALLCAGLLMLVTTPVSFAFEKAGQTATDFSAATKVKKKKVGAARATTVKSSKSNTSDRMGGGAGKKGATQFLNPRPESPSRGKSTY